jgi:predicted amidohydrolase YtcJ
MLIRNVSVEGRDGLDVQIADGRIAAIGARLPRGGPEVDGRGGALMMGLVDHHCHLLASAAQLGSQRLDDAASLEDIAARLRAAPGAGWLRMTGCPATLAERLRADLLDRWCPGRPVRVQDQTGALWVLSRAALALLPEPLPAFAERETGRVWRGDIWLGAAIGREAPDLAPIGSTLAGLGITAITDASASTDAASAALLAEAHRAGALPQRLRLMSAGPFAAPADGAFTVGAVKVLLDDHDLVGLDDFSARIAAARAAGRAVAVHCVTAAELALTLAAFDQVGSRPGDRVEHGGIIPIEAIPTLRRLNLTVVTQSGFIDQRGDRYLDRVDPAEQPDLYRCASLLAAGVPVAGSSDSPYADWDCWRGMRTAATRTTKDGMALGLAERVSPDTALDLYRSDPADPGGPPRRITVGSTADLCLLDGLLPVTVDDLDADRVAATWIGGRLIYPPH